MKRRSRLGLFPSVIIVGAMTLGACKPQPWCSEFSYAIGPRDRYEQSFLPTSPIEKVILIASADQIVVKTRSGEETVLQIVGGVFAFSDPNGEGLVGFEEEDGGYFLQHKCSFGTLTPEGFRGRGARERLY